MKDVTVSLDDATYHRARRRAALADRSLSSIVRELLQNYGADESEFERLAREEREIRDRTTNFDGGDRLARGVVYDRKST